jgi:hypothetical protein
MRIMRLPGPSVVLTGLAVAIFFLFQHASSEVPLTLRFINSSTGAAVVPDVVMLSDAAMRSGPVTFSAADVADNGLLAFQLTESFYDVEVTAAGYAPISTRIHAANDQPSTIEFHLDPLQPPRQLTAEFIRSFHHRDATVVAGYVVDDGTGAMLGGVRVWSTRDGTSVVSDEQGFFLLHVPLSTTPDRQPASIMFEKPGYQSHQRRNLELSPYGDLLYRIRMKKGEGDEVIDERQRRRRDGDAQGANTECTDCSGEAEVVPSPQQPHTARPGAGNSFTIVLPNSIRVGRNCQTPTSCTTIEIHTLESYCKRVLPAEIYSCWGSLTDGMNSLRAFSVPVRSYGVWHVYNPLTSGYDICGTSSCQVFGDNTTTNCNTAVDQTVRYVIATPSLTIHRAEYSAENNNRGCGNGFSGTGTSWPCIADPVCINQNPNGHGRGMCQWGSVRWATGTVVSTGVPCSAGPSHGQGAQDWQWIIEHYYPGYPVGEGAVPTVFNAVMLPDTLTAGGTFSLEYILDANEPMTVMLGASIAPAGTGNWVSDPANDIKVTIPAGQSTWVRDFTVPTSSDTGRKDMLLGVWYDRNNNNVIDSPPDFLAAARQFNTIVFINTLTVHMQFFTAFHLGGPDVRLDWRTTMEMDNAGFHVQRRSPGEQSFSTIGFVPGFGTTTTPQNYFFLDTSASAGIAWYRLRQVDLNGLGYLTGGIKVDVPTGVGEDPVVPSAARLFQNYPNPFNPRTAIGFQVTAYSHVRLSVYDLLGREVTTLVNEVKQPGTYEVTWDAGGFSSGVYLYRLQAGGYVETKKLVLLR